MIRTRSLFAEGCLLTFALLCFAAVPPVCHAAPLTAASQMVQLQGPLSVVHIGELRDGGLIVGLADERGLEDGVLFNYKRATATQGRLYADGRLVPLGSALQNRVLAAVRRYLDEQFTSSQQAIIVQGTLHSAAKAYGERGFYAWRLLHAIHRLESVPQSRAVSGRP